MGILPDIRRRQTFGKPQPGVFLTQDCLLCGDDSPALLCARCTDGLPWLAAPCCPRCALPTPNGETCGRCLGDPPHFDATRAVFRYEFPLDKLIQSFKYAHRLALAPYFGKLLAGLAADLEVDLVLPLPLHPERLGERGFNQSLELARTLAAVPGRRLDPSLCTRTRNTPAQAGLGWNERRRNLRNAFHCRGDLSGLRVALVDDVMTSGASLDECARTLRLHGATQVTLLVLARAIPG